MAYGYRYDVGSLQKTGSVRRKKDGFSMLGLLKEAAIGCVMGGLAGTAFYGAGKAFGFLKDSVRDVQGNTSSSNISSDEYYIPRDENGKPMPLAKQRVNGQDIPLPDPDAQGPHTVLGGKISSETSLPYRQSATFPEGSWPTANGKNVPWSEVHWGDHGKPHHHTNPHQHIFEYRPDKGGWIRRGPTIFEP